MPAKEDEAQQVSSNAEEMEEEGGDGAGQRGLGRRAAVSMRVLAWDYEHACPTVRDGVRVSGVWVRAVTHLRGLNKPVPQHA